jgi:hypothetical protein
MKQKIALILVYVLLATLVSIAGCSPQQAPPAPAPAPVPGTTTGAGGMDDLKKQIDDIKGVLPRFAIPMREVGSRYTNMYFAAKGGNWGLAAYMSKYMNAAMNPAKVTKPDEYKAWSGFYTNTFDPVNKAIQAKDFTAFDKAYTDALGACNGCHDGMGYKFVKQLKPSEPNDKHLDYTLKSEPGDVPK